MIDSYIDRPYTSFGGSKNPAPSNFCYEEFLRYYCVIYNTVRENDYQPQELKDEVVDENHNLSKIPYPKIIPMMSSKEKLKCQKIPLVLQYHFPSKKDIQKKMLSICCF